MTCLGPYEMFYFFLTLCLIVTKINRYVLPIVSRFG